MPYDQLGNWIDDLSNAYMSPDFRAQFEAFQQTGIQSAFTTPQTEGQGGFLTTATPQSTGIVPAIIQGAGSILGGILSRQLPSPPIVEAPLPPVTTQTGVVIPGVGGMRGRSRRMVWSTRLGMYVPAHRRMNILNPRALKRAMRRVEGFAHFAKRTISFTKKVKMKKRRKK